MRKIFLSKLLLMLVMVFASTMCFADNPIVQTIYTADPAPMVHDGTFYVYTGHDEDSAGGWFYMIDWRCFSSTDMANWTDHGSPLSVNTFSWASSDAWAAQCIYRNGKFYYYVTVKPKQYPDGWAVGVGVSDNPTGPFADAIGGPIVSVSNTGYIDPTVFIDDDGQAYLYWGNPGLWMVRLNSNMISYSGSITEMPQNAQTVGNIYAEAPWFYKRNGTYYLVFATDDTGEQSVAYSTSSGPTGPWSFRSKIMNPSGTSWTLHPGIVDYKGNSYLVYHNGALQGGGDAFHRSVCIDKFTYNADGTIPMIQATSSGPPQIINLNPYDTIQSETICWESGVDTETCSEGGMNVCNIENGDWIKVKGVDFGTAATSFEARVASNTSGGSIEIRLDSQTGTLVGTCSVSGTGGWQTWTTRTCTISGATGIHDLYLRFTGGSGFLFNFNWWKFYGGGETSTPTPEPTPVLTPAPTGTPNEEPIYSGGPYILNGISDYVDLPDGLTGDLNDFSVACWVKLNTLDTWSRIYDFGGDTNVFMMLTPASGNTGYPYFCITTSGNDGEQGLNGTSAIPTGSWQHLAVVLSGNTGILYINTQEAGRNTDITLNPADMGNTTNSYIGRSQWSADPYLNGEIDDFVIYNRALSVSEVNDLGSNPPDGTPEPTPTPSVNIGDVNGDGTVNIVDALLIAQYYVGLDPSGFILENADTNCDGNVNIVDALLVAQFYVGLINGFC